MLMPLYGYAATRLGRRVMEDAALLCVALNLVFAALDLITFYTNTAEILSFIRNANYGLLNDTELGGSKRIVGSFVEASSFGAMTLGYFAFSGKLWLEGVHPRLTLILAGLSFGSLLFSMSSTALVGLGAFLIVAYLHTIFNAVRRPPNLQTWWFIAATPIAAPLVMVAIALNESSSTYVGGLLNELVFNKMSSESGTERSSWNAQGLQNFIDTFGFGVGNRSMRALCPSVSLFWVSGALTMGRSLSRSSARSGDDNLVRMHTENAAKYACLAGLSPQRPGALVDLGLPFFAFAALGMLASGLIVQRASYQALITRIFSGKWPVEPLRLRSSISSVASGRSKQERCASTARVHQSRPVFLLPFIRNEIGHDLKYENR